ncbi:MAG: undecaprenyl-diphosphate phosphatase [Candidatus Coatesbacteria bacterium]|nr:undecaprenyl-diphosphate phosphatase [Candidatus Coatesbacteria bacterium]
MDTFRAALFGVVQGLTEFLPISSSGHLAVFHRICRAESEAMVPLGVVAHMGTLFAVLIFFRKELLMFTKALAPTKLGSAFRNPSTLFVSMPEDPNKGILFGQRVLAMIIIGSIPAGIVGILLKDWIEQAFSSISIVGLMFLVTAVLLFLTKLPKAGEKTVWHFWLYGALIIGTAQAVAIMPGISRSGATIATAVLLGFQREFAARFSFLLSIPAITGAFLLEIGEISHLMGTRGFAELALVFVFSFVVGYLSIAFLLRIVRKIHLFGFYCIIASVVTFLIVAR